MQIVGGDVGDGEPNPSVQIDLYHEKNTEKNRKENQAKDWCFILMT